MSRDELAVLDGGKCILQLRGVRPFLSDKYDLTQHPNYELTSDYDPKNTFDIQIAASGVSIYGYTAERCACGIRWPWPGEKS